MTHVTLVMAAHLFQVHLELFWHKDLLLTKLDL